MVTYVRSPKIAARVFGLDSPGQLFRSVPRTKFMFKAEFYLNPAAQNMLNNLNLNSSTDMRSIAFKVKTIDKPRITLTAQELNNYNKKRIVYTKLDYADAQLRIYDTVDNSVLNFWVNYFTYYFGDSRLKPSTASALNPTDAKFVDSTGWGLRPLTEETNFFNKISISAYFARTVTKFSYINPKITGIDWQQKDYSSSDLEDANITFKYEYIEYEKFGAFFSFDDDTGFLPIDALDVDQPTATQVSLLADQPRLTTTQTKQDYISQTAVRRDEFLPVNPPSRLAFGRTAPFPGNNGRIPMF